MEAVSLLSELFLMFCHLYAAVFVGVCDILCNVHAQDDIKSKTIKKKKKGGEKWKGANFVLPLWHYGGEDVREGRDTAHGRSRSRRL